MKTCSLCGKSDSTVLTETFNVKQCSSIKGIMDFDLCLSCYQGIREKVISRTGNTFDLDLFTELRMTLVKNGIKGKKRST